MVCEPARRTRDLHHIVGHFSGSMVITCEPVNEVALPPRLSFNSLFLGGFSMRRATYAGWMASAALLISGAAFADEGASLYTRIGGEPVVSALSNDLIDRAAADSRTERT